VVIVFYLLNMTIEHWIEKVDFIKPNILQIKIGTNLFGELKKLEQELNDSLTQKLTELLITDRQN